MTKPIIAFSKDKNKNAEIKKTILCLFMTILGTVIYVIGVDWFLDPIKLYSGGVTGISQIVVNFFEQVLNFKGLPIGLFVFLFNIPILIVGYKGVSKRFVICSIVSIVLQTVLMLGFIPVPDLGINNGYNPLVEEFVGSNSGEIDVMICALSGAIITGVGSGLALRFGGSTGGIDVLAQYLALKKNISIGFIGLVVNAVIAIIGSLIYKNPAIAIYTLFRVIIYSVIVDKVHTSYNFFDVEIISSSTELANELLVKIKRGVTEFNGVGSYTHEMRHVLEIVVSSYEIHQVLDIVKELDPTAFVVVHPVKTVFGNFRKKTVA